MAKVVTSEGKTGDNAAIAVAHWLASTVSSAPFSWCKSWRSQLRRSSTGTPSLT
jgi:hypothetical protein